METMQTMSDFVRELKAEGYEQQGGKFYKDGLCVCLPCMYVKKGGKMIKAFNPTEFKDAIKKLS